MNNILLLMSCVLTFTFLQNVESILYPYESEVREVKSLNGLWYFMIINENNSEALSHNSSSIINNNMYSKDVIKMPVPSSYNDITTNSSVRDHVGWVVYEREFYIPKHWRDDKKRIFLHFGSVHYLCLIVMNSEVIFGHLGGHIPFQVEITSRVETGLNSIKVLVNNTLTDVSLPQGYTTHEHPDWHPTGFTTYFHNCDYFDYAGINRPVTLYTTPSVYICDVSVETDFEDNIGFVVYDAKICGGPSTVDCKVFIYDKYKNIVAASSSANNVNQKIKSNGCSGRLVIKNVQLWWPIMSDLTATPGYLYSLEVQLEEDVYRLPIGIRNIKWTNTSLLINQMPIYFRGFGMHEDSDIRGRGFDNVVLARDINLIKWLGGNSFRTSHYPYADETLNEADSNGILVILETPACSLDNFDNNLLNEHKRILKEILDYHKNRPSVIMWSLANEPRTNLNSSESYFRELVEITHKKDRSRPVTFVTSQKPENDKAVKFVDIICVNRYNGWYQYPGKLDIIQDSVIGEMSKWYKNFSKPIIITEYGADSYIGQHSLPANMWTEDYQALLLIEHFSAFDTLRKKGFFIGEMIWNFIDFQVPQEYFRPGKCDKGLFTRNRQPKPAAYIVKERYHKLYNEIKLALNVNDKSGNHSFDNINIDLI